METCDWFSTAKPGDEQISLKEDVERPTETAERRRRHHEELSGVARSSAFSQCCSVSLRCFLTLCVERALDATCALTSHVAQHWWLPKVTMSLKRKERIIAEIGSGAGVTV